MKTHNAKETCKTTLFVIEDPSSWYYFHFLDWFEKHEFTIDIDVEKYTSYEKGPYWILEYPTIEHYNENGTRDEILGSEDCIEFLEPKIKCS